MKVIALLACIFALRPSVAMAGFLDELKNVITVTTTGGAQCNVYDGFQDNGDGTLTDPRNGLVWQKCEVGQTWNGSACSGSAVRVNWYVAMQEAKENRFLGRSDWRLPTKAEYESVTVSRESCTLQMSRRVSARLIKEEGAILTITPYGDVGYVTIHQDGGGVYWVGDGYTGGTNRMTTNHYAYLVRGQAATREDAVDIEREFQRLTRALAEFQTDAIAKQVLEKAVQEREACLQSNKPKLNEISAAIVQDLSSINLSKERMQQQREGAKYSGFVDKQLMYELGNRIASLERRIKEYFDQYKQLGGTEKSAELVRALQTNPCDALSIALQTKKELTNLSRLRYAQYGFLDSNPEKIQAVLGLEDTLYKVSVYENGAFKLDRYSEQMLNRNLQVVIAGFGFGLNDRTELKNFMVWFDKRFKPVYLKHLAALNSVAQFKGLEDVEGLPQDEKNRYFESVKYPDGPYDVLINPFPNAGALHADTAAVMKATSVAAAAIGK